MRFEVELSENAQRQLDSILAYIAYKLRNKQALENVMDDFDAGIDILGDRADTFGFCNSVRLREKGLRKLPFEKHRYLFIYRIIGSKVIVEGIYHELQDYEGAL